MILIQFLKVNGLSYIKSHTLRKYSFFLIGKSLFPRENFFYGINAFSERKAFLERIIEMEVLIMRLIEFTWTQARHKLNATNLSLRLRSNEGRRRVNFTGAPSSLFFSVFLSPTLRFSPSSISEGQGSR